MGILEDSFIPNSISHTLKKFFMLHLSKGRDWTRIWPSNGYRRRGFIRFIMIISGSGVIEFVEFLDMWANYTGGVDRAIVEAFKLFDNDGSGTISLEEFRKVMVNEGAQMSDEDIDDIIREADLDGDGQLNIEGEKLNAL